MNIGVVTEIKPDERRVAVLPGAVADLVHRGHSVFVQEGAGAGAGAPDHDFLAAGATMLPTASEVFDASTLIVHVKEPQASEIAMLRPDHILFTYLHLAAYPEVADGLVASGATAIAYETVEKNGGLPLLAPMSHIAGRLSTQVGAFYLMAPNGGMGLLPFNWVELRIGELLKENVPKTVAGDGACYLVHRCIRGNQAMLAVKDTT